MASATAQLSNYRQSPRKVRGVANLIRGKKVSLVMNELAFLPKRAADPLKKLVQSAVANSGIDQNNLYVTEVRVDKGVTGRRFTPRARGSMSRINKRSSHIMVTLSDVNPYAKKEKAEKVSSPKTSKAVVSKK